MGGKVLVMARPTIRELTERLDAQQQINEDLIKANEAIYSEYALLGRRVEELSFIDLNNITGATEEVLPQAKRVETILRIRRLRHENPMAKQAIKLALRFVLGKGIGYEIRDANTARIVDDFWNDPVNQVVWTSHFAMVSRFDELLTDGEQFIGLFAATGESPYVRLGVVPMEEITHILYDPDNSLVPVWYRRVYRRRKWDPKLNNNEGGWALETDPKPIVRYYRDFRITDEYLADVAKRGLAIPENLQGEGRIKHRMVNPLKMRTGYRGLSELFASREWFRVFKEFMEDRGAINAQANSITVQRRITGGPVSIANMTGRIGGTQLTPDSNQPLVPSSFRRPLPGSMVDTNKNVEYKDIRVDTGAPNAMRDAEMIRSTAGAGTATPDHYFGATNAALAGAQSVEVAVVKAFEDFQTFLRNDDRELVEYVLSVARDVPISEVSADAREVAWNFPPIMTHDIVKWVTAFAQWAQQVAPKNRVIRSKAIRRVADVLGVSDIEMFWSEVEEEEERLAEIEDEEREMRAQQQQMALVAPRPGLNGNGNPNGPKPPGTPSGKGSPSTAVNGGQKATTGPNTSGQSPDLIRAQRQKAPREGATGPRSRRQ